MSNASCGYQLFGVWDAFWWGWFLRGCPTPGREAGVPQQLQGPGAQQKEVRGGELEPAVTTAAQICPAQERQRGPGLMSGEEAVLGKRWGGEAPTTGSVTTETALTVELGCRGCREGGLSFSILPGS